MRDQRFRSQRGALRKITNLTLYVFAQVFALQRGKLYGRSRYLARSAKHPLIAGDP